MSCMVVTKFKKRVQKRSLTELKRFSIILVVQTVLLSTSRWREKFAVYVRSTVQSAFKICALDQHEFWNKHTLILKWHVSKNRSNSRKTRSSLSFEKDTNEKLDWIKNIFHNFSCEKSFAFNIYIKGEICSPSDSNLNLLGSSTVQSAFKICALDQPEFWNKHALILKWHVS